MAIGAIVLALRLKEKRNQKFEHEQVELWAKQVVKGKITEEQFGQRVSEI